MVYGQPPKDMENSPIDWKEDYKIVFKNRPCPYDFPAFEGDKPPDYDDNVPFLFFSSQVSSKHSFVLKEIKKKFLYKFGFIQNYLF